MFPFTPRISGLARVPFSRLNPEGESPIAVYLGLELTWLGAINWRETR
jgi:hypothetical protein